MTKNRSTNIVIHGRSLVARLVNHRTLLVALVVVLIDSNTILPLPTPAVAVELIEIIEQQIAEQNEIQHGFRIEHFDQWVFGNQTKIGGAKKQLFDRLQGEAESIQSTCKLADEQKEKLLLAGRGDIWAFLQQYAEMRAQFAEKMDDQQAIQNLWQEIQPLQKKYHGRVYGEGSLFTKVLDQLLDEEQSARMEKIRQDQRHFQYRATVMQLVSQFDQAAPFTHRNREKLLALIQQQTFPPKSTGGNHQSHFLTYFVLGQMADIPEDELRPLFEKAAWKAIRQRMKQGKSMQRKLKKQGLVPEKD